MEGARSPRPHPRRLGWEELPIRTMVTSACGCLAGKEQWEVHPGWRHPTSLGDVLESVALGYVVLDVDCDVVLEAYPGDHTNPEARLECASEDTPWIPVSYSCTTYRHWNDYIATGDLPVRTNPHGINANRNSYYTDLGWPYWLIEDTEFQDPHTQINEVRRLLGMEK